MRLIFETFKFLLKIDLRSRTTGSFYGRILLVLGTNFIWFSTLSFAIALSGDWEQNLSSFLLNFSFIFLSIEFLLIVFTILVEFDPIILNSDELEFFSSIPIDSLTYRFAKYLNFLFFVLLLSFSFNLPPALILLFLSMSRVSLAYFITSTFFVISVSNAILLVMLLAGRRLKIVMLRKFILPLQVFAIFLVFFLYQVVNKYFSEGFEDVFNLIHTKLSGYSFFMPQVVASKFFLYIARIPSDWLNHFEILLTICIWLFLFLAPLFVLKIENLRNILATFEPAKRSKKRYIFLRILERLKRIFFKSDVGFAVYELVYVHFRRDRSVIVKNFSTLAISFAIAIYLLIFADVGKPLENPTSRANVLMLISLFFSATAGIISLSSHRNYETRWVYNFITKDEIFEAINGGFKVLWHHILIPSLVIFSVVYLVSSAEIYSVFIHILMTSILLKIFFNLMVLNSFHFPFSQPVEKISSGEKILIQIFSFFAVICAILFERVFYPLILKFGTFLAFMPVFSFFVIFERYTSHILKQKSAKISYEK